MKTMTITDTYPFIFRFDQDRDEMMQRAFQNGVTRFFIPAIDSTYTEAMYDLEKNYQTMFF
jgi:TatD DNase family protein